MRNLITAALISLTPKELREQVPNLPTLVGPLAEEPSPQPPPAHIPPVEVMPSLWDWAQAQAVRRQIGDRYTADVVVEGLGLLRVRYLQGAAKYGVGLQTHNGRRPFHDALQESADLLVYLHQAAMEFSDIRCHDVALDAALDAALDLYFRLVLLCRADPYRDQLNTHREQLR